MHKKINVEKIFYEYLDGNSLIAFHENSDQENNYLIIQSSDNYDDQDISLGMNQVYIELNNQLYSQYGGIDEINVVNDKLTIKINKNSNLFKKYEIVKITLSLSSQLENYNMVVSQLKRISIQNDILNNL